MQVVGYRSVDPALLVASDGTVERVALTPGTELPYGLGPRRCAGAVRGDDEADTMVHEACQASTAPYCEAHSVPWRVANNADSTETHAVYVAGFAPACYKIGVTRAWRLETRLREQGADRGARVATRPDGRTARELESTLAARSGPDGTPIGEQVRVARKIDGLGRPFDDTRWERLLAAFDVEQRYRFEYGLDDVRPVPETIASGRVRGVTGRILVLDRDGTDYAVDMRDLLGYELTEEGTTDRQASLDAYSV